MGFSHNQLVGAMAIDQTVSAERQAEQIAKVLPANMAPVANGEAFEGVTGTGTVATFTVVNGVITGIALTDPV